MEIREYVYWLPTRGKKQGKSLNFQAQKLVLVANTRWSFTRGSNFKALTGLWLGFDDR